MPTASRRKAKQTKKIKTLTQPNQHSSAAVQGLSVVSENYIKMEGGLFNGTLQDTHKVVEEESLTEDNKEVVVEVEVPAAAADGDGNSSETPHVDIAAINDEQIETDKVEETEDVSESIADYLEPSSNVYSPNESSDAIKADQVENTVASDTAELELKEKKGEDFLSLEDTDGFSPVVEETELPPSEDNNHLSSSVSGNEGLRSTEVVGTEEEKDDVLSSVVTEEPNPKEINAASSSLLSTDVVSREVVVETKSDAKSDESEEVTPKGIEKSLAKTSTYEKVVGEQSDVQESSSSYQSAKECFQPSQNIADAESNSATDQQEETEEPRSFENPIIVPVTQRQHTSWKSCCGLFEILRHGDR